MAGGDRRVEDDELDLDLAEGDREQLPALDRMYGALAHPAGQLALQVVPWRGKELAEFAAAMDKRRVARRAERAREVVESAAAEVGVDVFLERIAGDEAFEDLVYRAAEVAAGARAAAKRRALRRALVLSARDHARVDEQRLIVDALATLEPPHVRLLAEFVAIRKQPPSPEAPGHVAPDAMTDQEAAALFPGASHIVGALLAQLLAAGLVDNLAGAAAWNGSLTPSHYRASDLGVRLLAYLQDDEDAPQFR